MKENTLSRRDLLRNALVSGCGLFAPVAFFGCTTKTDDNAAMNPVAFSRSHYRAGVATSSHQISVGYQSQPNGSQQCNNCTYFVTASNACQRVGGQIRDTGWCNLWARTS